MGLPYSAHKDKLKVLPADNTESFDGKVKSISCSMRNAAYEIFKPYNEALYTYLTTTSHAPELEKKWIGFSKMDCSDLEVQYTGHGDKTKTIAGSDHGGGRGS